MPRTLFHRLHRRFGATPFHGSRREFLGAAAGAALTAAAASLGACQSSGSASGAAKRPGVIIIGAGLAGLACADALVRAGYDPKVLEARTRVGGRVLSMGDLLPGKVVEGGGEFIGANHPVWRGLAQRFNLTLVEDPVDEGPIIVDGRTLDPQDAKRLHDEMEDMVRRLTDDARAVDDAEPWNTRDAELLDAVTVDDWLRSLKCSELCRRALRSQFEADNGQAAAKMSYLALLAMVKGGGLENYWTHSEDFRCEQGNTALVRELALAVGKQRVLVGATVRAIKDRGDAMALTLADGATVTCDHVVLTAPPAAWSRIDFSPKLMATQVPQWGFAAKHLSVLSQRVWSGGATRRSTDAAGDLIGETWLQAQTPDGHAALAAFTGGPAAKAAAGWSSIEADTRYGDALERVFPGLTKSRTATRWMNWAAEPFTACGYAFPAPGEVRRVGPFLRKGLGNLHFAGEYVSSRFPGYMEGALETGLAAAEKIIATSAGTPRLEPRVTTPKP